MEYKYKTVGSEYTLDLYLWHDKRNGVELCVRITLNNAVYGKMSVKKYIYKSRTFHAKALFLLLTISQTPKSSFHEPCKTSIDKVVTRQFDFSSQFSVISLSENIVFLLFCIFLGTYKKNNIF